MCTPLLAVAGIGAALQAGTAVMGGMAESKAAKAEARQYEIQRTENATATSQAARDRFNEFRDLEQANDLVIASSGLSAESFGVISEDNRRTALDDAKRIEDEGRTQDGRLKFAAQQKRSEAKAAKFKGIVGAAGSLADFGTFALQQ